MLSITHMAVGAAIAQTSQEPLIYLPAVLASHYLLDGIIHWDIGTGLSSGKKSKKVAVIQEIGELFLAFLYLLVVFGSNPLLAVHAWIGAAVSLIPDFLEAPDNFLDMKIKALDKVNSFHARFHASTPDMVVGLTPQLVILFVVYLLF